MSISATIRREIENRIAGGTSMYAIAKESGIDYSTLFRWLKEDRECRSSTLDSLAKYLGLYLNPTCCESGKG
jgi:DNA-binding phage protein